MRKNEIRLYNVLFPIWFYLLFPHVWLIILSVNFLIDSLALWTAPYTMLIPLYG